MLAGTTTKLGAEVYPGCEHDMISSKTLSQSNEKKIRTSDRSKPGPTFSLKVGDVVKPLELKTIHGKLIKIPDPNRRIHLQFRRYAGCPVCNLHMRTIAKRHDEITSANVREIAVFHSKSETMLEFQGQLPFDTVADPDRELYAKFGADRKMSPLAALNPRSWVAAINALAKAPTLKGARGNGENTMGLPSDFLIDTDSKVLAVNYGKRVDDDWSVDRILSLAREN
jgi:peroxiredoxin